MLSGKAWVAFTHKASKTFAVGTLGHKRGEDVVKWTGFDGQANAEAKAKFIAAASPATVIALLDELEAAEKRIDALSASHSKLHEGMAAIYNAICADGASTSLSAILTFVKRAFEESRAAAGITVKGDSE
ncbi:hypothetical protein D3C81_1788270 [compost metagenome]